MTIKSGVRATFSRDILTAPTVSPQRPGGSSNQSSVPVSIPVLWLNPEHQSTYVLPASSLRGPVPVTHPDHDLVTGLFCGGLVMLICFVIAAICAGAVRL
jgi:hypothetical protein